MGEIPQGMFTDAPLLVIDGRHQASKADGSIDVFNPSRGIRLAQISSGCNLDVDLAVSAARKAFDEGPWSSLPPSDRKATLHRLADLIHRDAELFDQIDAIEMGKPVSTWRADAAAASEYVRYHAEAADKVAGTVLPTDGRSYHTLRAVPRGVVGAITPWNFPTYNAAMKIGPALAAGNTMVLKPSELSSFSALRLAQLGLEAGLPPGVLNVVLGHGHTVGKALALHEGVDMITFTGSTNVGKLIMQYAGQSNMKKILAECGGKCPQVVFDDGINLDAAAEFISLYLLTNQGQVCSAGTRLLVQRSLETKLLDKLTKRFNAIKPGDAWQPDTTFGPLVSKGQCEKVLAYIEAGTKSGGELVVGGTRLLGDSGGNFIAPTIFRDVPSSASIAQEEIFGPVLSVTAFDEEAEAIELANGTRYGLNAYVWTADLGRGMRMGEAIRSTVSIRSGNSKGIGPGYAGTVEPLGDSGIGPEGGLAGLSGYLRHHAVGFFY